MALRHFAQRVAESRAVGDSVWVTINALVAKHGAVNLGQGFPDFSGNEVAKAAAKAAVGNDENQYPPPIGMPQLRSSISQMYQRQYGMKVHPEHEVTVTVGASEALYTIMTAMLNPGDEVVLFQPFFDIYLPPVEIAGAKIRAVDLVPPQWSFDKEKLRAAITPKTKMIFLNSPHNPTGKVFQREELEFIAELCIKHDLLLVSDEVYEFLVFDGQKHIPPATLPGMWDRTLTVSSGGKTFSLTGWKVGWVVAPAHLQAPIRSLKQYMTFAGTRPLQLGIAAGLDSLNEETIQLLRADFQKKRDFLVAQLQQTGLDVYVPQGGYFVMAGIGGAGMGNDFEFCSALIRDYGVAAIPSSPFYLAEDQAKAARLVRFAICKKWETLQLAAEKLQKLRLTRGPKL
eukprot:TRINITY_DN4256_c0_g1_i1.p1 TRINITY_DN4256_c0_g1~~TRINITY_DN4256_c0_g1_i1.p1  ORF type:complete len:408 (-),score=105.37 TRINITY_DN4256_c0_g1_i1:16-1215(-)